MPTRQGHYYLYDASDIHPDSIAVEMFDREECFREEDNPVLYVCGSCGDAARMMEEATICQEEASRVKKMERATDYFFQVQRTRLISLEPVDSARKWKTFKKIVEAYNLGETGDCCFLSDYISDKGTSILETVYGEKGAGGTGKLKLPGNEQYVAELINRYNKKVLSMEY
jgi:hypothetical protein